MELEPEFESILKELGHRKVLMAMQLDCKWTRDQQLIAHTWVREQQAKEASITQKWTVIGAIAAIVAAVASVITLFR